MQTELLFNGLVWLYKGSSSLYACCIARSACVCFVVIKFQDEETERFFESFG